MTGDTGNTAFVFQGVDAITQTACAEWRVDIANIDELCSILSPESDGDPNLQRTYYGLSKRDMRRIGRICLPPIVPHAIFTGIRRPSPGLDAIPYLVHTNFELPLMLEGRKPLAVFADGYPSEWFDEFLAPFEPFVVSGQFVRRIIDTPMPHLKLSRPDLDRMRTVLFALPEEAWRIDAYIDDIIDRTRDWDDDLERLQGSLLGYEEWQNDWWIRQCVKRREVERREVAQT